MEDYEEDGDVNRVCGRGQVTREKVQTDEYWWECDNVCCLSAAEKKRAITSDLILLDERII